MTDPQRLATVESYRRHLADHWQIRPHAYSADVDELLDPDDRASLIDWRRHLLATADAAMHARFYDWLAHPRRFGPVHSLKWMEILTSGIWAAAVLSQLAPRGPVLDLGSGAGYWTAWLAARCDAPVVGIDACTAAIEFGWRTFADADLPGKLRCGDFEQPIVERAFAAVSLQGLTRHFHAEECDVLERVAANLRTGGYLILVDELPGNRADYDRAFAAAELTLVAAGPVGGLAIDHQWNSYTGLVLQRRADTAGRHSPSLSQAESAVEQSWQDVHPFATADHLDGTQRNTAYWWAGGAESVVRL